MDTEGVPKIKGNTRSRLMLGNKTGSSDKRKEMGNSAGRCDMIGEKSNRLLPPKLAQN